MVNSSIVTAPPPPAGVKPMAPPGSQGTLDLIGFISRATLSTFKASLIPLFSKSRPTTNVQTQPGFHVVSNVGLVGAGLFSPTSEVLYPAWCKKAKKEPQITPLAEDASALWCFGSERPQSPQQKIFLYFHGGGYSFGGTTEEMMQYLLALRDEATKAGVETSGVLLRYSLATEGTGNPYPKQLTQGVVILNHLIGTLGWKPSQIIITGESAGSNLMFATLLHSIRPCPHVPHVLTLSEPIFMVIALSPFVMLNYKDTKEPAVNCDYITHRCHNTFVAGFLPPRDDIDIRWGNFEDTPKEWWVGLGKACKRILITAGTEEILCEDIERFGQRIVEAKAQDPDGAEYELSLKTEVGVHCEPSVSMGAKMEDIPQWLMVKQWFNEWLLK